jgi:hypothetical protein
MIPPTSRRTHQDREVARAGIAGYLLSPVHPAPHSVDQRIAFSEGMSVLNPRVQREGVVLRPLVEGYDEDIGGRLSFKAINPKFLLK